MRRCLRHPENSTNKSEYGQNGRVHHTPPSCPQGTKNHSLQPGNCGGPNATGRCKTCTTSESNTLAQRSAAARKAFEKRNAMARRMNAPFGKASRRSRGEVASPRSSAGKRLRPIKPIRPYKTRGPAEMPGLVSFRPHHRWRRCARTALSAGLAMPSPGSALQRREHGQAPAAVGNLNPPTPNQGFLLESSRIYVLYHRRGASAPRVRAHVRNHFQEAAPPL